MSYILGLWLESVPVYTVDFCRSIIVLTFLIQLNSGLMTAIQAIGRIKVYQIVAGSIQLLTIPIGYIFLKKGYPPYSIIRVAIGLEVLATIFRISYFNYLTQFPILKYVKEVLFKSLSSLFPIAILLFYIQDLFVETILGFFSLAFISSISYLILIILIGLTEYDKKMITQLLQSLKNKIIKK